MQRIALVLALVAGFAGGALAPLLLPKPAVEVLDAAAVRSIAAEVVNAADKPAGLDRPAVAALIEEALAKRPATAPQSTAQLDAALINPMIEDYLLSNPRILERVNVALTAEIEAERAAQTRAALATVQDALYNDADHIVLGNPEGDVTLVEMFDYNCGYCRQALPDLATLLAEDPDLKVILKEFPILSQDSVAAARVAVLVADSDANYWDFHQALFTARGQVNAKTALDAAKDLGLNPVTLEMEMGTPRVTAVIEKSYELARALQISGTPTFIIGDKVIPGAVPIEQLRTAIANMRECGSTTCPAAAPANG